MAGDHVYVVLPCCAMHAALMRSDLAAQDSLLDIMGRGGPPMTRLPDIWCHHQLPLGEGCFEA